MFDVSQYQADLARRWVLFYQKEFGITLTQILIPEPELSFEGKWLIIRDPKLSAQELIKGFSRAYDIFVWTGRDLNGVIDQRNSVRNTANGPYGIWVEAGEEPDEDLMDKSGASLKHLGITLEEYLLLAHFHWQTTGQHLDCLNRTLCSGSTYDNDGIPSMGWDMRHNRLIVDCCFLPNQAHKGLCVRKVIASPKIPQLGVVYQ